MPLKSPRICSWETENIYVFQFTYLEYFTDRRIQGVRIKVYGYPLVIEKYFAIDDTAKGGLTQF